MAIPGPAGRLGWYARRLASMAPAEVAWRGFRLVEEHTDRFAPTSPSSVRLLAEGMSWRRLDERFRRGEGRPVVLDRQRARRIAGDHPAAVAELVAAADRVRAGYVTYFGYPEVRLAEPVDWNHDPVTGFRWPPRAARSIDHRASGSDPKWIWELNRLQHLPWLAEAWLFTGDDGFAECALDQLDGWSQQNPVGRGIAWRGAFEAGIRAISVAIALQGLRDHDGLTGRRLEGYVRVLAAGADLCWRRRSLYSSANNHLVGELAGLAVVAMMFPELRSAARWERDALAGLRTEAARQILADGTGAEQAVGYQVFTAELLLLVAALLTARGDRPPSDIVEAVDRSAAHLARVVGAADPDPRHGDDDEGFALRLGPEPRRTVRQHLGLVAALGVGTRDLAGGSPTLASAWVSAVTGTPVGGTGTAPGRPEQNLYAEHGGLVVLRHGGQRVSMDVGPLGHLSIAAHGHADALALTLSLDGQEVVGDPGAGSYYGHPAWRVAHRGTRAHATVTVDGTDQSVAGGPFLWTRHAQALVRRVDLESGVVDAEHDGYRRLADPVTHRRWLVAPGPDDESTVVVDEVSGRGEHEVRVSWPLHPDLDATGLEDGFTTTRGGRPVVDLLMAASERLVLDRVRGDEDSHLGWWSDRLESRRPAWLLGGVVRGPVPLVVATVLAPRGNASAVSDPSVTTTASTITVCWRSGSTARSVVVDRSRPGAVERRSDVTGDRRQVGSAR